MAGLIKNTVDNLADITKLKAIDTNSFVLKTQLASDVTTLENKIDNVDKKTPDISGLATKNNLNAYLQTSTFHSKVTDDVLPQILACPVLRDFTEPIQRQCFQFVPMLCIDATTWWLEQWTNNQESVDAAHSITTSVRSCKFGSSALKPKVTLSRS